MRLAVVSPFVDRRHGTERAIAELLERLARVHHCEVHLYSQEIEDLSLQVSPSGSGAQSMAIVWHKVPLVPGPQLVQFTFWLLLNSLWRAWDRHVHHLRFDLILSPGINCFDANIILIHALFHRLCEVANDPRLTVPRLGFFRRVHRRLYYTFLTRLERHIYGNPKVTLAAVSHRTAALLGNYFQRQDVAVIPNAVDTTQFSPSARLALRAEARRRRDLLDEDLVLLLIGNDWSVKGLETILRAISLLLALPLRVLIAGSDSVDVFQRLAKELGILDRCHFESLRLDVLDFYAAADLYVSPSLEDSFGLPVAEAMACGLPAISSPFAGVSELIQDGVDGFLLRDPRDPQELASLLEELFHHQEQRERIAQAAAQKSSGWTWDRNAAAVWELLKQAASLDAPS